MPTMDQETLQMLMRMNLIKLARDKHQCPDATADLQITAGKWGTDMDVISQTFTFNLTLNKNGRTVDLNGTVCLSTWPGTDRLPEVKGKSGGKSFQFYL